MSSELPPGTTNSPVHAEYHISQQQTQQHPAMIASPSPIPIMPAEPVEPMPPPVSSIKQRLKIFIPIVLILALMLIIYFVWNASNTPTPPSPISGITPQNFGNTPTSKGSNAGATPSSDTGNIQVYIVGAVKNPGVYTLPTGARVYALLQAAGGPLPKANLVALNLAAKLTDGEEVYVTLVGETPPTYMGGVPGPGTGTTGPGTNSSTTNTGQL